MMNSDVGKGFLLLLHAVILFQRVLSFFLFFKSILPIPLIPQCTIYPKRKKRVAQFESSVESRNLYF
jgi:hypothetical protein